MKTCPSRPAIGTDRFDRRFYAARYGRYRHSSAAAQRKRGREDLDRANSGFSELFTHSNGSSGVEHRVEVRRLGGRKWLSHFDVDQCSFQFSSVPAWMPPLEMASLEEVAHDYTRQPSSQTAR